MSDLGHEVSSIVTGMVSDLSRETAKLANESVKQMLIFLINKAREQGDRPGEKSLKKLLQSSSNDEVKLFDLEKKHLKELAEKAKKYQVPYAVIEDQGRHSIFYRGSDETRVKAIIETLLEKQLTSGNNEDKKSAITPAKSEMHQSNYDFEIVNDQSIKVKQAVLDLSKPVERALAMQEGVNVEAVLAAAKEKSGIQKADYDFEIVNDQSIKVKQAVLDLSKPVERALAMQEGVNVETFLAAAKEKPKSFDEVPSQNDNKALDAPPVERTLAQEEEVNVQGSFEDSRISKPPEAIKEIDNDERFNKAVELAKEEAEITIPKIQSELGVGYSVARGLMDRMEAEGLITPYDGTKPQQYIGDNPKLDQVQTVSQEQAKEQKDYINSPKPEQSVSYEHLEGTKIRVPSVTLDLKKAEHRELAESYGIKVAEIDFKRETTDLRIEVRGKESLNERLVALPEKEHNNQRAAVREFFRNVEGRLSLDERREQIRPIMAAAKEAAPAKNKTKERGGR